MAKRKTYRYKQTAKQKAGKRRVYKVKGGWRIACKRRKRRR